MPARMSIKLGTSSKQLQSLGARARDVSPAWPKVGAYLSSAVRKQFVSEGAYFGKPWRPLRPEYRRWKIRQGLNRKILVATGAMRKEFTGRPMDLEDYGPKSATFGSNNPRALWHHYGTRHNGKRVNPPRPILVTTQQVRSDVKQILHDWIKDGAS